MRMEEQKEKRREAKRRCYQRIKADPERWAKLSKRVAINNKIWDNNHREARKEQRKRHYERIKADPERYAKFLEKMRINQKRWRERNPEKWAEQRRRHHPQEVEFAWQKKLEVIKKLGGRCICCGENNPFILQVNHINGVGKEHRLEVKTEYSRILQGEAAGVNLLCANCNILYEYYRGRRLVPKDCENLIPNFGEL